MTRQTLKYTTTTPDILPLRKHTTGAAGYDLLSMDDVVLPPHEGTRVGTGVSVAIPEGWMGLILPRSSWTHLLAVQSPPIDSDYRGEIRIIVHNIRDTPLNIARNSRFAQLVIIPCLMAPTERVGALSSTDRDIGGFGSTGQ